MQRTTFAIIIVFGAILSSCYYHNWETLHPQVQPVKPCTLPDTVSYSHDIVPIINASCSLNNPLCHSSGSNGGDMTTYAGVYGFCSNTSSKDSTSDMYLAITWSPPYNSSGMPQTGNRLSQCDINKIVRLPLYQPTQAIPALLLGIAAKPVFYCLQAQITQVSCCVSSFVG